jgi:hypothetical protein
VDDTPFSPPEARRRRRVASRMLPVQAVTFVVVAMTTVGLILYFVLRTN